MMVEVLPSKFFFIWASKAFNILKKEISFEKLVTFLFSLKKIFGRTANIHKP